MDTPARQTWARAWKAWFSSDVAPVGPAWLPSVLTAIFCIIVAACFTVLGMGLNALNGGQSWHSAPAWLGWYSRNLAVSLIIGYLIRGLFAVAIPAVGADRLRRFGPGQRALFFSSVPLLGVAIGWPLGVWLITDSPAPWLGRASGGTIAGMLLVGALISFIFYLIFSAKAKQAVAEKRAVEAQMRLLQAQMEPHFLFNTLANVQSLLDTDVARAREMLESFTDYLRASLTTLRAGDSTWARELELAETYLRLQHLRMEDRLRYTLDTDADVAGAPLPPLLLQPLVENAVLHGLEPQVDGGHVRIVARREAGQLVIEVRDDGRGLEAPPRPGRTGNGIALTNLRQRLDSLYGGAARLELVPLHPGTLARLRLPLHTAAGC